MCCDIGNYFKVENINSTYTKGIYGYQGRIYNIKLIRKANLTKNRVLNHGLPITEEEFNEVKKKVQDGYSILHLVKWFQRSDITIKSITNCFNWEQWVSEKNSSENTKFSTTQDVKTKTNRTIKVKPKINVRKLNNQTVELIRNEYRSGSTLGYLTKEFMTCTHNPESNLSTSKECTRCKNEIESLLLFKLKCDSAPHKLNQSQKSIIEDLLCIRCGFLAKKNNFLLVCKGVNCQAAFWDKTFVNKIKKLKTVVGKFDYTEAKRLHPVLKSGNFDKGNYVYVIYLKKNVTPKSNNPEITHCYYVGKTNVHPYHRLLKHQVGDQPSTRVQTKKRSVYLRSYEGPMTNEQAAIRERTLTLELNCPAYSN